MTLAETGGAVGASGVAAIPVALAAAAVGATGGGVVVGGGAVAGGTTGAMTPRLRSCSSPRATLRASTLTSMRKSPLVSCVCVYIPVHTHTHTHTHTYTSVLGGTEKLHQKTKQQNQIKSKEGPQCVCVHGSV